MHRSKTLVSVVMGTVLGVASLPSHALLLVEMDNADTVASVSGDWIISTKNLLYYGDNYFAAQGVGGAQTRTVTYRSPTGYENDGTHCFYASWSDGPGRPTNTRYRIDFDGNGTFDTSVTVDQTENGGEWRRLTCSSAGSPGDRPIVEVSNFGVATNKFVVADGVRITREDVDRNGVIDEPGLDWAGKGEVNLSSVGQCNNPSWTNLTSVTITAPTSGYVLVEAAGIASNTFASGQYSRVGIDDSSTGKSVESLAPIFENISAETANYENERRYAIRNVYSVSAGSHSYYLKGCKSEFAGGRILWDDFTAIFFPTRY
jgi:hypothetical protein